MQLERNISPDRRDKYAVVKLREVTNRPAAEIPCVEEAAVADLKEAIAAAKAARKSTKANARASIPIHRPIPLFCPQIGWQKLSWAIRRQKGRPARSGARPARAASRPGIRDPESPDA